ncbi:MAG TPA: FADH(2)-oxidizing methylenetetrahydrofolate--tRNA-(uracil(54)-C(5))-methyltransferase TrmFO [Alphaproteobacteria bacterium]|nr:methylenetetrahydrofolate--tRNA-(uracil(54)-C(5))-methyltransferase (FADH(2)-oxidizing) TrmFO [Paracoccaceae bacterium]RCL79169.1 MAG: methylenetetrahydrofolate--tRNA-(uracil(54)-C(5))-methyltransferase (FADH(2)-oxidizing) TrmFO [SAR116 cluster bacterium]HCJ62578.1 FADH(2)-oxidizing methylenetetrahydrofolate--tRNA-(uracil(54)-C(5))-methyltransferase TrmFO [Alphaproteobacteria bacterium]HCY48569.1 FADH(2)-oxidizing methylenetetrahydrofolate--tRNA-(uracil(54)-C(5))-methyltransferase TrmFO [Alph|tara:strand:+ start:4105 stop:5463 length:1359 start_codon:yes stop_codon:yes gene_type:complete
MSKQVHVIGAGLAGSEAAYQLAMRGIKVVLHEMRPGRKTHAHETSSCAELVCSNSFRSDDADGNAVGLLHQELRRLNSLVFEAADANQVPAGGALAVDRVGYAEAVTRAIKNHPNITMEHGEVTSIFLPNNPPTIVATGPLTSDALTASILEATGLEQLAFFDAIAPIVYRESVNMDKAWFQSRYDKVGPGGDGKDYLNCPMNQQEYEAFLDALIAGEKTEFKEWEKNTPYFEGCLPVEVMAERGRETLRFGPLKPVGLTNPHDPDNKPHAIVQLRQDNKLGTLYNLVGFQTKLRYGAQQDVFRMIPGLEQAEFARLGGIHRNTFIQSPKLLDQQLRLRSAPHIRFAGQITGVEGYVESCATGMLAAIFLAAELHDREAMTPGQTTALGALLHHVTGGAMAEIFQPMNVNFGLFTPIDMPRGKRKPGKRERAFAYCERARKDIEQFLNEAAA